MDYVSCLTVSGSPHQADCCFQLGPHLVPSDLLLINSGLPDVAQSNGYDGGDGQPLAVVWLSSQLQSQCSICGYIRCHPLGPAKSGKTSLSRSRAGEESMLQVFLCSFAQATISCSIFLVSPKKFKEEGGYFAGQASHSDQAPRNWPVSIGVDCFSSDREEGGWAVFCG